MLDDHSSDPGLGFACRSPSGAAASTIDARGDGLDWPQVRLALANHGVADQAIKIWGFSAAM